VAADYEKLSSTDQALLHSPYVIGTLSCLRDVAGWLEEKSDEEAVVAYVFEDGIKGSGRLTDAFSGTSPEMRERYRYRSLTFGGKRDFLPLQAADLLAYETYRVMPRERGQSSRPVRKSLMSLLNGVDLRGLYWTPLGLRQLVEGIRADAESRGLTLLSAET
jgi:hypothetical protein